MTELDAFLTMLERGGIEHKVKISKTTTSGIAQPVEHAVTIDNGGWSGATFTFNSRTGRLIDVWIGD